MAGRSIQSLVRKSLDADPVEWEGKLMCDADLSVAAFLLIMTVRLASQPLRKSLYMLSHNGT